MPISKELQDWVDQMKAAGLEDADLAPFIGKMEKNEKVQQAVRDSVLTRSDYSRKMDELRTKEQALTDQTAKHQAEQEALIANASQLRNFEADWKKLLAKQDSEKRKAESVAQAAREKLVAYGASEEEINALYGGTPVTPKPAEDLPDYVKKADFETTAKTFASTMPKVAARLVKLQMQHQKLWPDGSVEFDPEKLLDTYEKEGLDLDRAWSKVYNVEARKSELQEKSIQARIQAEVGKERARILSESPPGSQEFRDVKLAGSPVLHDMEPVVKQEIGRNPVQQRLERVGKAVQDFRRRTLEQQTG